MFAVGSRMISVISYGNVAEQQTPNLHPLFSLFWFSLFPMRLRFLYVVRGLSWRNSLDLLYQTFIEVTKQNLLILYNSPVCKLLNKFLSAVCNGFKRLADETSEYLRKITEVDSTTFEDYRRPPEISLDTYWSMIRRWTRRFIQSSHLFDFLQRNSYLNRISCRTGSGLIVRSFYSPKSSIIRSCKLKVDRIKTG